VLDIVSMSLVQNEVGFLRRINLGDMGKSSGVITRLLITENGKGEGGLFSCESSPSSIGM